MNNQYEQFNFIVLEKCLKLLHSRRLLYVFFIDAQLASIEAKPVKFVKDDYDYQDKGVLDKIRKVIDYEDLC